MICLKCFLCRHFFKADYPEPAFKVPLIIPLVYTLFLMTVFITPIVKVYYISIINCMLKQTDILGSRYKSFNTSCINNMFWFDLCCSQEN